uniref:Uncharacterized protein n=1 Tax=Tanacetum cinerariifolium TaxID=118510 RepID=A0A6L2NVF3_TANCI|nr:hypothetical protein [Tanacetum cinerariifolium]
MIQPEPEGSTQGYLLVSVEVLRPTGIVIRAGGSMNVGARSKSLLNVREMAASVDNVGGNKVVRTRFIVLGLRACDNLDQQP